MNMIIEIVNGVAYAVADIPCKECMYSANCLGQCTEHKLGLGFGFRSLTAEEREKLRAALDAGEQCKGGGAE